MAPSTESQHVPVDEDVDFETDVDEEEIDQLDSDLDGDDEIPVGDVSGASSSKARPRRSGERVPGHTLIPATRIENIMHADGSGGHMSKEALFMLSIATEDFIKRLAEAGLQEAGVERRYVVSYRDVASATQHNSEFSFLQDTVPFPVSLAEACRYKAAKEKELLEDDPAISAPVTEPNTLVSSGPSISHSLKSKSRIRQPNGREKPNGIASTNGSKRQRDNKGRWSQGGLNAEEDDLDSVSADSSVRTSSARIRNRTSRTSRAAGAGHSDIQSAPVNGASSHQNGTNHPSSLHPSRSHVHSLDASAWGAMPPPAVPLPSHPAELAGQHLSGTVRSEDRWSPALYTGPASGYLEDHRMIFSGRNAMSDVPGRTIYSHQRPSNR
ncbi:hypothetical protein AcW1_007661 [Taiwanofungus camphoratus]|nr:hypothetical protein AcV5_007619 [Antrodia cinnamomea]KAI0953444.1 hypothetical protein AcW1_007661 [Antrodia cinnamomea]